MLSPRTVSKDWLIGQGVVWHVSWSGDSSSVKHNAYKVATTKEMLCLISNSA